MATESVLRRRRVSLRQRQRGIVAVIVTVGMVALLAMVGLAIDVGHLTLSKSRLQSSVDAAALAAAKRLADLNLQNNLLATTLADTAARTNFDLNAAQYPELNGEISGADLMIQFSATLNPFTPGSMPPNYVRVRAQDFDLWTSFTRLVGNDDMQTAAAAVAGPVLTSGAGATTCNLVPVMVCGNVGAGAAGNWGFSTSNVTLLKVASQSGGAVGPGNFQLIELGEPGADAVRENLAGEYSGCLNSAQTVTTKPGNNVGPTSQGLNTRFNQYQGGGMNPTEYPPDLIVTEPTPALTTDGNAVFLSTNNGMNPMGGTGTPVTNVNQLSYQYSNYQTDMRNQTYTNPSNGRPGRRIVAVPIVDCSTMVNGHGTLPLVGVGCFFLLQRAVQQGTQNYIYAQYVEQCQAGGGPVVNPGGVPSGPFKIVLHNDPASPDS